jgi:hypothetical protein
MGQSQSKNRKEENQMSAKPIKDESLYEAIDHGTVVMPWGKYKGLQLKHIDPRYLNWVLENSVTELQRKLDEGAVRAARRGGYKEASEVIKRLHQPVISSDLKVHLTAVTEQWEKYGGEHPIYRRIEEPNENEISAIGRHSVQQRNSWGS